MILSMSYIMFVIISIAETRICWLCDRLLQCRGWDISDVWLILATQMLMSSSKTSGVMWGARHVDCLPPISALVCVVLSAPSEVTYSSPSKALCSALSETTHSPMLLMMLDQECDMLVSKVELEL